MKNIFWIIGLVAVSLLAANKKFLLEAAQIEYKYSGQAIKGTQKISFEEFGHKVRIENHLQLKGQPQPDESIFLLKKDSIFLLNPEEMTYMDVTNTEQGQRSPAKESQEVFDHGKYLGIEQIQGKKCEVWSYGPGKFWLYKGLILKSSTQEDGVRGSVTMQKLDVVAVAEEKFEIPSDYKQVENPMDSFMNDLFADESDATESTDSTDSTSEEE